ncbi:hypothetical protein HMPREF1635_03350 [Clostridiales bacterium S5-A14a]|nr:hypothetical protein HMPREF1635_03350 [Clostridiales bacterium S5-A14a]
MLLHTEAVVLKRTRAAGGVNMLTLFTKKYGKISVSSKLGFGGKRRSELAISPFTLGDYKIFSNRGYYNLDTADVVKSYYAIGEDIKKYGAASLVLEMTGKMIAEEQPMPDIFTLLKTFLELMEVRQKSQETLVLAYEIKILTKLGYLPQLDACVSCGSVNNLNFFSIDKGGLLCSDCRQNQVNSLIYGVEFDIIGVVKYFEKTPFRRFKDIALKRDDAVKIQRLLREYMAYHMDIGELMSDSLSAGLFSN